MVTMQTNFSGGRAFASPVGVGDDASTVMAVGTTGVIVTTLAGLALTGALIWGGVTLVKHLTRK